ncbi:MAG: hypothetical protein RMJ56_14260 [Gemmataceae bacterium]|nr:hypothetical protein [Gemmata sp.]MDW8198757.1 hypothetical protein [Gemmataceae bacterium]
MKRLMGWVLTLAGGAATLWGGFALLMGESERRLMLTPEVSVNALTGGLLGVAVLTVGLLWVRD